MRYCTLLLVFIGLFNGCLFVDDADLRTISATLTFSDKPIVLTSVLVFPEGFNLESKENTKQFLMLKTDDLGKINFKAKEKNFFLVVGGTEWVLSGYLREKNGEWSVDLFLEDKSVILEKLTHNFKYNKTMYCHDVWCRWNFCKQCCVTAGFEGCYHYYSEDWNK